MKTVLITGGASGLGLALAHEFAAQGYSIAIADIQEQQGQTVAQELTERGVDAFFHRLDVTQEADWQTLHREVLSRWGQLDVIINNAGVAAAGLIEDQSIEDWRWLLDINVLGVVLGCKMFTPLMKRRNGGHIINVASMAGLLHAPSMSSYNVSKAGVVALSETLKAELSSWNIGVSVVCPAFFQTNLTNSMRTSIPGVTKTVNKWMARSSVTADDVAKATFKGMKANDFFILTHTKEKLLWWLKRLSPDLLHQLISKTSGKQIKKIMEKVAS
jgi:NAD(P)-dependent dehydrogenase (short-subunit alcohol dehydrogenase family)